MRYAKKALGMGVVATVVAAMLGGCTATGGGGSGDNAIHVIAQTGGPGTALKDAADTWNKSHDAKVSVDLFDYDPTRQRTVLSFSLEVELDGRWPWAAAPSASKPGS